MSKTGLGAALVLMFLGVAAYAVVDPVHATLNLGEEKTACKASQGENLFGSPSASMEITVVGDSLSTGFQLTPEVSWPSLLAHKLTSEGYSSCVRSLAENGAGFIRRGDEGHAFPFQAQRVPRDASFVFIYGSSNDIGLPFPELRRGILAVIQTLKDVAPHAQLLFVGPLESPGDDNDEVHELRDEIQGLIEQAQLPFVDPVEQRWLTDRQEAQYLADGIHPSKEGHGHLAGHFQALLHSLFTEKPPSLALSSTRCPLTHLRSA